MMVLEKSQMSQFYMKIYCCLAEFVREPGADLTACIRVRQIKKESFPLCLAVKAKKRGCPEAPS